MLSAPIHLAQIVFPLRLENMSILSAGLLFVALSAPIVWLGIRSLRWMDSTRRWVSVGLRISCIWLAVLLLAGARWVRTSHDLEVILLRDESGSVSQFKTHSGESAQEAVDALLKASSSVKPRTDRLGVIGFDADPFIEVPPDESPHFDARPSRAGDHDGTDIAAAIRLGLASFRGDAMQRLVLISDGNETQGDTRAELRAASSRGVHIDVLPLNYRVAREVAIDQIAAPSSRHTGEAFSLDLIIRSTNPQPVPAHITVTENGTPIDLDEQTPGTQTTLAMTLQPGANPFHVRIPSASGEGMAQFHASVQVENSADDTIAANNTADATTFIRGKSRILYVDNVADGAGDELIHALASQGVEIAPADHIGIDQFPSTLTQLQGYDAVILANVPHGPAGLNDQQDQILAQYVRDCGGGLLVIGGPDALGAGNWQGTEIEKILPVNVDIPAQRILAAGALVLVIDHSGSMGELMPGSSTQSKQQVANESAILSLHTLLPDDWLGVIAFDSAPQWVIPLAVNHNAQRSEQAMRSIQPGGGTDICPALEAACDALEKIDAESVQVKRILLMTDGMSEGGNYDALLKRLSAAKIKLSTIAVGGDADRNFLAHLASAGGGTSYAVDDPNHLKQIFIREARLLRRPLIWEPSGGIHVAVGPNSSITAPPMLAGMVLTTAKTAPTVQVPLLAVGQHADPVLARWQIGLGKSAVFTSDATRRWAPAWVASPMFGRFWAELVQGVERPADAGPFEISTQRDGSHARIIVRATNSAGESKNFMSFVGRLISPDPHQPAAEIHLSQTAPGIYETTVDTPTPGNYFVSIESTSLGGQRGSLAAGIFVPASSETHDLQSNESLLSEIATRTGGRILSLESTATTAADLFSREGLSPAIASQPIQDWLIDALMATILFDVAVRRLAWDWQAILRFVHGQMAIVHTAKPAPPPAPAQTLAALSQVRDSVREQNYQITAPPSSPEKPAAGNQSSMQHLKAARQRAQERIQSQKEED